jgi:outer membrane immunogenic protein
MAMLLYVSHRLKGCAMTTSLKALLAGVAACAIAVSAAQAADLPSRSAPAPLIAAVPVFTWTGFYVGVNAGYGWSNNDSYAYYDPTVAYYGDSSNEGGFIGGGQIGYNYQMGAFVIGAEADIQYADLGASDNGYAGLAYYGDNSDGNYFGTVRLRLGFAFDRALIYATGGLAYGDIATGSSSAYGGFAGVVPAGYYYYGSDDSINTGWTLGAGFEYAFTDNLTGRIEGLYVNLDTKNNSFGYYSGSNEAEFGVVRAGLNYKFSSY